MVDPLPPSRRIVPVPAPLTIAQRRPSRAIASRSGAPLRLRPRSRLAFGDGGHMLRRALICLQSPEFEAARIGDPSREATAGSPGAIPHRRMPTSISTSPPIVTPNPTAASDAASTSAGTSTHNPIVARPRARQSPEFLRADDFVADEHSPTPPWTSASASPTFWQHMPTAPAAICRSAIAGICASWHAAAAVRPPTARTRPSAARCCRARRGRRSAPAFRCRRSTRRRMREGCSWWLCAPGTGLAAAIRPAGPTAP